MTISIVTLKQYYSFTELFTIHPAGVASSTCFLKSACDQGANGHVRLHPMWVVRIADVLRMKGTPTYPTKGKLETLIPLNPYTISVFISFPIFFSI